MVAKSLAPRKFEWNFRHVIFKQILVIDGWGIPCEIALILMSLDFPDDQSTLVQVMAWCRQATSHYLSQCWPRSLLAYGVIMSFKDEIQASDSENCILKQKVDMFGNNNRVQHNATQCCNQPSAHTIVHWRNGWPGGEPTKIVANVITFEM